MYDWSHCIVYLKNLILILVEYTFKLSTDFFTGLYIIGHLGEKILELNTDSLLAYA